MLIEGFLQHIANNPLTHIGPECAALVLGEDQFMNLIFRKCMLLESGQVTQKDSPR
jgi:hypothetical protein